jgi:hypothetical protein
MKHIKLFETFQPKDVSIEGFSDAWEDYKKNHPGWTEEDAMELALSFYKDPDDAEKAVSGLLKESVEWDHYTAIEDLKINGSLGKYSVKSGELVSIDWTEKMPGNCLVQLSGKLAQLNKAMLEDLIEEGKLKSTEK